MKKNKVFTTPCFMVVTDKEHAIHLLSELKNIGDRKLLETLNKDLYPCVCAVSTNIISICESSEMASGGFIDCKENEKLFLAIAALRNGSDIHQWFTDGTKWVISDIHPLLGLKEYFHKIGFNYSKTHKASVEELIKYFDL